MSTIKLPAVSVRRMSRLFAVALALTIMGCSEKRTGAKRVSAAEKMQRFVVDLSAYAKKEKPGFIIIPQNGPELAFTDADVGASINQSYINAIDAFAVEELFYNGDLAIDEYRVKLLTRLRQFKPVMVSEFITNDDNVTDAVKRNDELGFITFPRTEKNYHYSLIPERVQNENSDDIKTMADAKNYLYLINAEKYDSKQQVIDDVKRTNFDLVTIDLFFDADNPYTPEEINRMKVKANGGKRLVIAYINIGAAENWRYYWKKDWRKNSPSFLAKQYAGYDNEFWVNYWEKDWQDIIIGNDESYMKKIMDAGFDGAYLDNVEAYYFLFRDK